MFLSASNEKKRRLCACFSPAESQFILLFVSSTKRIAYENMSAAKSLSELRRGNWWFRDSTHTCDEIDFTSTACFLSCWHRPKWVSLDITRSNQMKMLRVIGSMAENESIAVHNSSWSIRTFIRFNGRVMDTFGNELWMSHIETTGVAKKIMRKTDVILHVFDETTRYFDVCFWKFIERYISTMPTDSEIFQ